MPKQPRSRNSSRPWGVDAPGRAEWLRSPSARILLAAALAIPLLVAGLFVAVGRLHSLADESVEHPARTATDGQTETEVVQQARSIVAIARLPQATAGYMLMSCKNHDDPPYQGAVYLSFALPADGSANAYFKTIAAAMVARGWREGLPPNQHLNGKTVYNNAVTAILYPDGDNPHLGVARIYGRCQNMNDHRADPTAWVDITDQLH